MQPDVGIHAYGAYVPRLRLDRAEVAAAHAWLNPGLRSLAQSSRSVAGPDEDAVTMAAAAARAALAAPGLAGVTALVLATTTAPFAVRSNAGIVATAAGLGESTSVADCTGSTRAGTTALLQSLAGAGQGITGVCVASDKRTARAAGPSELTTGHGAAAMVVGPGSGIARLLGSGTVTVDFLDRYRATDQEYDYGWEERWVRDEGYLKIAPRAIADALTEAGLEAADIDHFCLHASSARTTKAVAAQVGIKPDAVADDLGAGCGDTGAAHPLLMLAAALENAQPGQRVLVVGFGQGADALVFEVTEAIGAQHRNGSGSLRARLAGGVGCTYPRYLVLSGMLDVEWGIRAEADKATALTAHYRHRDLVLQLAGGRCESCGTHQIPRTRMCANTDCRAVDTQAWHSFADSTATIVTWSADNLTVSPDPPAYYGLVDFAEGGRMMMDFTDVDRGIEVGTAMRMVFRVKDRDVARGFTRYYWKAAPTGAWETD